MRLECWLTSRRRRHYCDRHVRGADNLPCIARRCRPPGGLRAEIGVRVSVATLLECAVQRTPSIAVSPADVAVGAGRGLDAARAPTPLQCMQWCRSRPRVWSGDITEVAIGRVVARYAGAELQQVTDCGAQPNLIGEDLGQVVLTDADLASVRSPSSCVCVCAGHCCLLCLQLLGLGFIIMIIDRPMIFGFASTVPNSTSASAPSPRGDVRVRHLPPRKKMENFTCVGRPLGWLVSQRAARAREQRSPGFLAIETSRPIAFGRRSRDRLSCTTSLAPSGPRSCRFLLFFFFSFVKRYLSYETILHTTGSSYQRQRGPGRARELPRSHPLSS